MGNPNWFELNPEAKPHETALFLDTKTGKKPCIRIASRHFNNEFWDYEQASSVQEWVSMLNPSNIEQFKESLCRMVEALEELEPKGETKML